MDKKGNFMTDHTLDWSYIIIILIIILLAWVILSGKLAGYIDAIGDLFRMRR